MTAETPGQNRVFLILTLVVLVNGRDGAARIVILSIMSRFYVRHSRKNPPVSTNGNSTAHKNLPRPARVFGHAATCPSLVQHP